MSSTSPRVKRVVTLFRGLTVCIAHPACEKEPGLWTAYFSLVEGITSSFSSSANHSENGRFSRDEVKMTGSSPASTTTATPKPPPTNLPPELLPHILYHLPQRSLHTCLHVCRLWHRITVPLLYHTPKFSHISSLRRFADVLSISTDKTLWRYGDYVKRIQFHESSGELQQRGDTQQREEDEKVFEGCYSTLFELLVVERRRPEGEVVNKIFLTVVEKCPNLEGIEELFAVSLEENTDTVQSPHTPLLTHTILQNLLSSSRHIVRSSQKLGIAPENLTRICTTLLELFESESRPIFAGLSPIAIRTARGVVLEQCRMILNRLSTAMFLEAQYLALSSQKLLDRYAVLYYRGFAGARGLDVGVVVDGGGEEDVRNIVLEVVRLVFRQPVGGGDRRFSTQLHSPISPVSPNSEFPLFPSSSTTPTSPPQPTSSQITPPPTFPTRHSLNRSLSIFPPPNMNAETAELISTLLSHHADVISPYLPPSNNDIISTIISTATDPDSKTKKELTKWFQWFQDVIHWQRAGREMEAVKELLRGSMGRMEGFRGIQRRFGMVFID